MPKKRFDLWVVDVPTSKTMLVVRGKRKRQCKAWARDWLALRPETLCVMTSSFSSLNEKELLAPRLLVLSQTSLQLPPHSKPLQNQVDNRPC